MANPREKDWAISMACFCDIPLSSIAQHTKKYGNYAIGIKKTEAIKQGVSPVLYVHGNSGFFSNACNSLRSFVEEDNLNEDYFMEDIKELLYMLSMMKPYEGYQNVDGKKRRVRFYDEREWRYLPPLDYNEPETLFLSQKEFQNIDLRRKIDARNEKYGVTFSPDAINYIIVEKEDEILPLIDLVGSIKGDFPHNSVKLLTSRILSMERIREDF